MSDREGQRGTIDIDAVNVSLRAEVTAARATIAAIAELSGYSADDDGELVDYIRASFERAPGLLLTPGDETGERETVCTVCSHIADEPHGAKECYRNGELAAQLVEDYVSQEHAAERVQADKVLATALEERKRLSELLSEERTKTAALQKTVGDRSDHALWRALYEVAELTQERDEVKISLFHRDRELEDCRASWRKCEREMLKSIEAKGAEIATSRATIAELRQDLIDAREGWEQAAEENRFAHETIAELRGKVHLGRPLDAAHMAETGHVAESAAECVDCLRATIAAQQRVVGAAKTLRKAVTGRHSDWSYGLARSELFVALDQLDREQAQKDRAG